MMQTRTFILKRLIEILIIFFVILTVLFLLFRLSPGDPVTKMVDPTMTPEDAAYLIDQLGLDQPIGMQYLYYLKNFFTGNFGISFHYGVPVFSIILNRLPNTVLLFSTSILLSAFAGIFLGKIASWYKGEKTDTWMTLGALIRHTLFLPWLALIMIWIFGFNIGWFPLNGMISPEIWLDSSSGFWLKMMSALAGRICQSPLFTS